MAAIPGLREQIFGNTFSLFPSLDPLSSKVEVIVRRGKFEAGSDRQLYKAVLTINRQDAMISKTGYSVDSALQNLLDVTADLLTKKWAEETQMGAALNVEEWEESDTGVVNVRVAEGL